MISKSRFFHHSRPQLEALAMAVFSVIVATLLRWLLDPVWGENHPMLLYYGVVAITAWYGGWRVALITTILSWVAADWFFMEPRHKLNILDPKHSLACGIFLAIGLAIAGLSEAAKRAIHRAETNTRRAWDESELLKREINERKRVEAELKFRAYVLAQISEAVAAFDMNGRLTYWNPAAQRLYGYTEAEALGRTAEELFQYQCLGGQNLPMALEALRKDGFWHSENIHKRKNGQEFFVESSTSLLQNEHGEVISYVSVLRDMTERRRVERELAQWSQELDQRVKERTAQLESAYKEMEAFCYSISHDLRAPIRSIHSFTQIMRDDYAAAFDEAGRKMLGIVMQSSLRMDQLIYDLLYLSRVSRSELRSQPVNLSTLARAVTDALQSSEPRRAAEFVIAPDLVVHGDERLLRIALENLLGNAWKFTGRIPRSRIEFGVISQAEHCAYFVRDNGIGFDMAYVGKLFGTFQRLHSEADFPGTGIGLVTVQRIIHRHGGRIWAEGATNQGATFYFTLPDAAEQKAFVGNPPGL